jgi:hypothetical protein
VLVVAAAASGCGTHAEFVHPDFSRFDVRRIGIYNVENSTVFELRSVSFGGAFQRTVFGVPEYDIHSLLQGAIEEALLLKDYETVSLGPAPSTARSGGGAATAGGGAATLDRSLAAGRQHDAELSCAIVFWKAEPGARPEMEMRFRVEIHSAAGEKLYAGTFKAAMRETARTRTQPRLETVIRPAVLGAFEDLPLAAPD